jgi:hypothetical protein
MTFLMQPAPAEGVSPTIAGAVAGLLVVVSTQLPGIIKTGRSYIDSRTQERRSAMKLNEKQMQQALDQTEQLLKELSRRDEQLARRDEQLAQNNTTMNQSQQLMNEMRAQMNAERAAWQEERKTMLQAAEVDKAALQALAKENFELRLENQRLKDEKKALEERLSQYETDTHRAVSPAAPPSSATEQKDEP